jgi:hypothetical protein
MSAKRFKFVSPGVFVNEIDNSQLPGQFDRLGPVIIGRTERGPSMRPVKVESQAEFVEMFGNPIAGGMPNDVWREGNYQSPTYASYAAMAYLRNNGPVTMVRLLGHEHENHDAAGSAGWKVDQTAYGLFLYDSASSTGGADLDVDALREVTGTLAAVFYVDSGGVILKGAQHTSGPSPEVSGTCVAVESVGANFEFRAQVLSKETRDAAVELETTFNFDKNSDKFIRKVFNTNPALTSEGGEFAAVGLDSAGQRYWLGQTFEDHITDTLVSSSAGDVCAILLPLDTPASEANGDVAVQQNPATPGTSGWVFSQQLSTDTASFAPRDFSGVEKLFKVNALDCGEWESTNLKVSIEDVRYSRNENFNPYGSFSVVVRRASDNDAAVDVLERFANCNLNPMSPDYIKRKIGDQTLEWDEGERRYKVVGDYPNSSQFIRVEVNSELDNAALDPRLLPFGFQGPSIQRPVQTGAAKDPNQAALEAANAHGTAIAFNFPSAKHTFDLVSSKYEIGPDVLLEFPQMRLRESSETGDLGSRKAAYFGVDTLESGSAKTHQAGWCDLVYPMVPNATADALTSSFAFSLDDVKLASGQTTWAEGNRAANDSISSGGSWKTTLDEGVDKFTMPLHGGFDGLDVRALDPFAPDIHVGTGVSDKTSYEYYSIRKAVDTCSDPEVVECNLMSVPGITTNAINQHLINVCERRADALAVLDLKGGYKPRANRLSTEDTFAEYGGTVNSTLDNLDTMAINSSYACSYYPWVQVRDQLSDSVLWVPPSVAAIGTMGSSEAQSEIWFAPAGFTRGGLSEGSAGMPVIGVRDRLTSKQRDDLYSANVNPIASFPAEGIVIFGQKTMQVTPSALDRINVRRLMIFVKKEISRMAATTLFDQNVRSTWNRFLSRVKPFLRSVQTRLGLTEFKVILDETTTTPELIDRNIMYAKILLKPARAIEYIAVDFVITNSGASFED